jgi:hypothetical protein
MAKKNQDAEISVVAQEEQKQFSSKYFHKTFARPEFKRPEYLIHRNVEKAGVHNEFSTEQYEIVGRILILAP